MDLADLRDADFALLSDAVDDWSTVVGNLEDLREAAEKGLHGAANKANWAGVNATVSREFIGKTAGEFGDAHGQARSIHRILKDTWDELVGFQGQLTDALERGRQKNLKVIGYEGGFTVTTNVPPEGRASQDRDSKAEITALRDEIQGILQKATESDTSASTVLKAIADQSRLGFSDADYRDRDSAAEAIEQADQLAHLAKKNPADLTPEEFDRLTAGLKKYGDDELFAERFATRMGAGGTLDFWAALNDPQAGRELSLRRGDSYDDLQRYLGLTLATASQSDSVAMSDWRDKMVDLVDKPVGRNAGFPVGAQVMSNLMRWGDFDDTFLVRYGEKLMETEKKYTGNGEHGAWGRMGSDPLLSHTGSDSGWDPMTGYLKALSNSPDAATTFFNQEFIDRNDENNPFERDTDGNGRNGKVSLSNFQYLFEERDWPRDLTSEGEVSVAGRNTLALALEAATTGHPAGELPTVNTPPHNREQARLMENLVASIADNPERLTRHGYMTDSIGQITSEYLPDLNRAMSDVEREPGSEKWQDIEKLYPVAGAEAKLEHSDVTKLLFAVGQNEEGYAAVEVGQKAYMGKLMDHHLDPDLPAHLRVSEDPKLLVQHIAGRSGEVSGTLGLGVQEFIGEEASDRDKQFEHAVAQRKNWISGGIGTATGVGVSFVATPWVGAAVGGGAGTVTSVVLEAVFKDAEGHALSDAQVTGGKFWSEGQVRNIAIAEDAARTAAEKHGLINSTDVGLVAQDAARQGYFNARTILEGQAPGSLTNY
ncbi:DUF6571 family protein [Streptomyces sp. NPDC057877]|uniref:DUF6571 family protein n=1 Tax=Streptomyces sp. NPDC057877 TaxID=3346269 RepID=UPI0036CB896F